MITSEIRLIWEGTCHNRRTNRLNYSKVFFFFFCLTWARCFHWHAALWNPFHTEATQQTLLATSRHPPESSYELIERKKAVKKSQKRNTQSWMETILPSEDFQPFQSSSNVICWSSWWSLLCLFACCCCCISSMINYNKKRCRCKRVADLNTRKPLKCSLTTHKTTAE